jgi:hypothetical protein
MQTTGRLLSGAGIAAAMSLALSAPVARAEVVASSESGFVVRLASEVTAPAAEAWKSVLTPAQWWQSQHTFSGDAANLVLDSQVGGCFCEVLPRPEGAPPTQKPGGVQHMRVIYMEPPRALRLAGALGPLQSEALAATLTITVKPTDTAAGKGSRILFEYVVGGFMRYKVEDIAAAVDRMLAAQLASLSSKLGPVTAPVSAPAPAGGAVAGPPAPEGELPPSGPLSTAVAPLSGVESYSLPPKGGAAVSRPAPKPAPAPEAQPAPTLPAKADGPSSAPPATAAAKQPSAASAKPSAAPAAKLGMKPAYLPSGKSAAKAATSSAVAAKPAAKSAAGPASKAPAKTAAKAPDPEAEARREANAMFDAALTTPANP